MNRALSGRAAKGAGDLFECWIEIQNREAVRCGLLACVEKNEAHSKVVGRRVIYTAAGVADYTGTVAAGVVGGERFRTGEVLGGLTLAAEAKSTKEARLTRAAVQPRQQVHLTAVARAGGLALLLVEFRGEGRHRRHAVPWLEVPWRVLKTAESVAEDDLGAWEVSEGSYLDRFLLTADRRTV